MPAAFVITGLVRSRDGDEPTGLSVVVEERKLPSRERQEPAGPAVLGQANADREGRFQLGFQAADGPDLGFTVLARDGRRLMVDEVAIGNYQGRGDGILFNAVSPLEVTLTVTRANGPVADSEYESLLALIEADLAGLALADLAEDDLDFLARDLGRDTGDEEEDEVPLRLAYLRAADLLSRSTHLIGAAFYGWARLGVPDLWNQMPSFEDQHRRDDYLTRLQDELAHMDADRLAEALRQAVDARIIPAGLAERSAALAHAIRRRSLKPVYVRLQLVRETDGQPLAAYTVAAFDGSRELGADVSDALGVVTIAYDAEPTDPNAARDLRLWISGPAQAEPVEVTAQVAPPESEVKVPLPTPPDLQALVTAGHLQLSPGTLDALRAAGIAGYADLRRRGGIAALAELDHLDPEDVSQLDALTELDLLTSDPSEAATLLTRNYRSVSAIAAAPWGRFLTQVTDDQGLPYERAVHLRTSAQAQAGLLDLLLAGYGSDLANGFDS